MSSIYGKNIKISIFGQSHSEAIGVTVDGLPAGFTVDTEKLSSFMAKRSASGKAYATRRSEPDKPEFICGLLENTTCGAPLTAIIHNTNTKSKDYENLAVTPRPSHADYTAELKYAGFQDKSGGGHFSGRLTAPLCIAGSICKQILEEQGIFIYAHIKSIKDIEDDSFNPLCPIEAKDGNFPVLNESKKEKMLEVIENARTNADSVGGIIECGITGVPVGLGEPMFEGVENRISQIVFGVPAVKGIEFGNGFDCTCIKGSENNDSFILDNDEVLTKTNNHGGILGGISSGMPIIFRVAIKPTPSIGLPQQSVNLSEMEETTLTINGRHDPCIVPRAVPCIEAAAAIAMLDMLLD
ncbi:MAG: chorismate synthase [Clostridia bacterium]|nr:chorismate synthase [Clostridia bacterium]